MISRLKGIVVERGRTSIILDVAGVGYELWCTRKLLESIEIDGEATVAVYTAVREDDIRLYGFVDLFERQVFLLLLQVSGVGPKIGSEILSNIETQDLLRAIGAGDLTRLQAIKGIGRKTAERIVLELRDKVGEYASEAGTKNSHSSSGGTGVEEALAALQALGFNRKDAERAVERARNIAQLPGTDPGHIVKEALKYI